MGKGSLQRREKRVSTRVSLAEWQLLSRAARLSGFATVSELLRDVLGKYCSDVITRISEKSRRDNIGAEIEAMFRHYEDTAKEWGPDINKRK